MDKRLSRHVDHRANQLIRRRVIFVLIEINMKVTQARLVLNISDLKNITDWAQLGSTGPDWDRLGPTGPDWAQLGPTGPDWDRLGPTGTDWPG